MSKHEKSGKRKKIPLVLGILLAVSLVLCGCADTALTGISGISSVTATSLTEASGEVSSSTASASLPQISSGVLSETEPVTGMTTETATGKTTAVSETVTRTVAENTRTYILNTNTYKFHKPDCGSVKQMSDSNKLEVTDTREAVLEMGYVACQRCNP